MATAINSPARSSRSGDKVELEIGVPQILKLLYDKPRETEFSLMFSTDQGTLFVPVKNGEGRSGAAHATSPIGARTAPSRSNARATRSTRSSRQGGPMT